MLKKGKILNSINYLGSLQSSCIINVGLTTDVEEFIKSFVGADKVLIAHSSNLIEYANNNPEEAKLLSVQLSKTENNVIRQPLTLTEGLRKLR